MLRTDSADRLAPQPTLADLPTLMTQVREAGLPVPDDRMMTPVSIAVVMFTKRGYKRVMVLGTDGLTEPLREAGIEVVPPVEAAPDSRPERGGPPTT